MRLLRIISGLVRGKRLRNGCLVQNHANGLAPGKKGNSSFIKFSDKSNGYHKDFNSD